jgi:LPS export ABC transporter protein LptC
MPESAGKDIGSARLIRSPKGLLAAAVKPRILIVAACILVTAGCSLNYEEAGMEQTGGEGVPDTVLVGVDHKIHRNGRLSMEVQAERAETFNSTNQTILTDTSFVELDAQGGKATEGQAGRIVYHSDTENAEISGSVQVHSASEKGTVTAESLSWENKQKLLTAPPAERVLLRKDDGSYLSGSGFQGDFRKREITFSGPVQGMYVSKDKEEKKE